MSNQEWTSRDTGNIVQSRDTGNIGHKTQNEDKQNKKYNTQNLKDEQHGPHQKTRG